MLFPPPLAPGARARVVGSSGPFDLDLLNSGRARLEELLEFDLPPGLEARRLGFLAGNDEERRAELEEAWRAKGVDAVWLARGGYGIGRFLGRVDLTALLERPRWFLGFSDGTGLHLELARRGLGSLHAPNLTSLARATPDTLEALRAALAGQPQLFTGLTRLGAIRDAGAASSEARSVAASSSARLRGRLWGGNLTVIFTEAAAGRLQVPEGALLVLEDVSETSYRVDRMLTALIDRGLFHRAAAVLLGDFTDCSSGKFDVPVTSVLEERLGGLPCPVLQGLPVGHGERNLPFYHGGLASVDLARGELLVEPR